MDLKLFSYSINIFGIEIFINAAFSDWDRVALRVIILLVIGVSTTKNYPVSSRINELSTLN